MSAVRLSLVEVLTERLVRHGLTRPAADEPGYLALFRRLPPVSPQANSYPGSAPRLMYRTTAGLGDEAVADELSLYAAAYRRSMTRFDARQEAGIRALAYAGPLSPRQLCAETSLAHRSLMAAVHRLERAFVVCEDQTDDAWDRPLYLVEREFPDL